MRRVVPCVFALLLFPLCGCSSNKERIHGIWELESGVDALTDSTWEFTPDGKVKIGGKLLGQPFADEGTYSIRGNTLTMNMKIATAFNKTRIVELTDTRLVMKDDGGGKEAVFKKRR